MYVHGILENATDFFVIRVDEELQTLIVTAVDSVLFQSVAQGLVNGETAALSGFFDARVADFTVAVGMEMRAQVAATHATRACRDTRSRAVFV